jgi:hypothetical protein
MPDTAVPAKTAGRDKQCITCAGPLYRSSILEPEHRKASTLGSSYVQVEIYTVGISHRSRIYVDSMIRND